MALQASAVSEELLKTEYDAARIMYNRFVSAITFKPTLATVLSPDVSDGFIMQLLGLHQWMLPLLHQWGHWQSATYACMSFCNGRTCLHSSGYCCPQM